MKLMEGRHHLSWKALVSLVFSTFFLSASNNIAHADAGLCNGNWGMVGGYYCDIVPISGGKFLCVFLGKDNDRNGAYRSGTADRCLIADHKDIPCDQMCSLNNNCSKVTCLSSKQSGEINAQLKLRSRASDNEERQ